MTNFKFTLVGFYLFGMMLAFGENATTGFTIEEVRFRIEGRTKEFVLRDLLEISTGTYFTDEAALESYIADKTQLLKNQRVLEEVIIDAILGEMEPGKPRPVHLIVRTTDSWNIVGLPYFKYDSNDGLLLALRGRDYNFFGTMTTFLLNVNWQFDTDGQQYPSFESKFSLPFDGFNLDWVWRLEGEIVFPEDGPADFNASTTIDASKPIGAGKLGLALTQAIAVNDRDSDDVYYDDPLYFRSTAKLYYAATLLDAGKRGKLLATPFFSLSERWAFEELNDDSLDTGPILTPGADLSFGRVNWIGNFRNGFKASVSADLSYYPIDGDWSRVFTSSFAGYGVLGPLGPSARLTTLYRPDSLDESAGDALRGVLDARVDTDCALYLNLDLPLRLISFRPADWFHIRWMRIFHFEQQWSPFFDMALGHFGDTWFDPADGWYSTGLEVITFPKIARAFYVRISLGWDLAAVIENGSLSGSSSRDGASVSELFIGLGHLY